MAKWALDPRLIHNSGTYTTFHRCDWFLSLLPLARILHHCRTVCKFVVKSALEPRLIHNVGTYNTFHSMKWLGVSLLSLDKILVHFLPLYSQHFLTVHWYSCKTSGWWEILQFRVNFLAQKHNIITKTGFKTQTSQFTASLLIIKLPHLLWIY